MFTFPSENNRYFFLKKWRFNYQWFMKTNIAKMVLHCSILLHSTVIHALFRFLLINTRLKRYYFCYVIFGCFQFRCNERWCLSRTFCRILMCIAGLIGRGKRGRQKWVSHCDTEQIIGYYFPCWKLIMRDARTTMVEKINETKAIFFVIFQAW